MKFSCDRSIFSQGIGVAGEVISSKNAVSIMSNVLLDAKGDRLTIRGTDAKTYFQTSLPIQSSEDGAVTIFCDKLGGILSSIPAGDISLESTDGKVVIKSSAKKVRFQVKSIASDKFPEFPEKPETFFSLAACDFIPMIDQTISSISDDETRYFLNGVCLESKDGGINAIATDGRRLSFSRHSFKDAPPFNSIIIPAKFLTVVRKYARIDSIIELAITPKMVFAKFGDFIVSSVLVDGQFPNYRRVIPESQDFTAKINRRELSDAIKRVALFTEKAQRVILNFEAGKLTLESDETELGKAHEEITCEYSGDSMRIACNFRYLEDPLKVLSCETVSVKFTRPNAAMTILDESNPDTLHIVMPMQIE